MFIMRKKARQLNDQTQAELWHFKHLTTIIWGLCHTIRARSKACNLCALRNTLFHSTEEISCYLWLSRPQLLKHRRTKQDWLSGVERLGQSWLIRQTKCYFCFLCGWRVLGRRPLPHYPLKLNIPRQPSYYSTFLYGLDSSLSPCFHVNSQHLRLQLFAVSYLYIVCVRACLCRAAVRAEVRTLWFATLTHNLKVYWCKKQCVWYAWMEMVYWLHFSTSRSCL